MALSMERATGRENGSRRASSSGLVEIERHYSKQTAWKSDLEAEVKASSDSKSSME